jgi:hypothetical protein
MKDAGEHDEDRSTPALADDSCAPMILITSTAVA